MDALSLFSIPVVAALISSLLTSLGSSSLGCSCPAIVATDARNICNSSSSRSSNNSSSCKQESKMYHLQRRRGYDGQRPHVEDEFTEA